MAANRKVLACERCGRPVKVGVEAEAARCWACCGFIGDPPAAAGRSLDAPHRRDLAECCNYSDGTCIVRERGSCIVLDGGRCGWWEKAVRPGGGLSGRVCAACGGEVPKRRRYCEACRRARRRAANRKAQGRKRVSCQQSIAPTPPNYQESEAARGTFREALPGVAAHAQNADAGEDGPEFSEAVARARRGPGGVGGDAQEPPQQPLLAERHGGVITHSVDAKRERRD